MTAWEEFQQAADHQVANAEHVNALAKAMMLALGYSERSASQVARLPYQSVGLVDQRKLWDGVLKGIVGIATASRAAAHASTTMAEHVIGKPLPPLADE